MDRRMDGWTHGDDNNNYFTFLKNVGIMSIKRHTFSIQKLAKYTKNKCYMYLMLPLFLTEAAIIANLRCRNLLIRYYAKRYN